MRANTHFCSTHHAEIQYQHEPSRMLRLTAPVFRLVYGADNDLEREVRISCPDATGLGCDVTRMLLDFGLRIVHGDMSTDGKWCFLIFRVSAHLTQHDALQQALSRTHKAPASAPCWHTVTRQANE